jgi:outer membrane lipoprotein carrier protein
VKRIFFVLILIFNSHLVFAESASDSLAKQLSRVVTFSSDFTQEVLGDKDEVLQHSVGKMQFNRPSLFYWHVVSPSPQTMWYRNSTLIVYDPELAQATSKKVYSTKDPSLLPLMLLTGDAALVLKNFSVEFVEKKYILKPISDGKDTLLIGVILILNSDGAIREIQYQTTLGQKTKITFEHVTVNKKLDQAIFFDPLPVDTDIVHVE